MGSNGQYEFALESLEKEAQFYAGIINHRPEWARHLQIPVKIATLLRAKKAYIKSNKGNWLNVIVSGIHYDEQKHTFICNCWQEDLNKNHGGFFRKISIDKIFLTNPEESNNG